MVCGRRGTVEIDRSTHKILGKKWYYYNKNNTHFTEPDRYYHRIMSLKRKIITRRVMNNRYEKISVMKPVGNWECSKCFGE